jgi:hypothetical protein
VVVGAALEEDGMRLDEQAWVQRLFIIREKRCRDCIFGLMYSVNFMLESDELDVVHTSTAVHIPVFRRRGLVREYELIPEAQSSARREPSKTCQLPA